jgi:pyridoxamine 5'-phosphate oxidase-like protein
MTWAQFVAASPELAVLGGERMERHGLILLATLRRDGSPRISPVEPLIVDGELELGMMWRSTKALDLLRDPRCHVHTIITDRNGTEGEFKLWGRARDLPLPERARYCDALEAKIGWRPKEPFHCFAIAIESAAFRIFGAGAAGKVRALVWKAGAPTVESETSHPI